MLGQDEGVGRQGADHGQPRHPPAAEDRHRGSRQPPVRTRQSRLRIRPVRRRAGQALPRPRQLRHRELPLKLVLIEDKADEPTVLDHLGSRSRSPMRSRPPASVCHHLGCSSPWRTRPPDAVPCWDQVWVREPGAEPWDVYTRRGPDSSPACQLRTAGMLAGSTRSRSDCYGQRGRRAGCGRSRDPTSQTLLPSVPVAVRVDPRNRCYHDATTLVVDVSR